MLKHSKQGTFIDNLFDLETGVKCEISNLTILKDLQPRFCCWLFSDFISLYQKKSKKAIYLYYSLLKIQKAISHLAIVMDL